MSIYLLAQGRVNDGDVFEMASEVRQHDGQMIIVLARDGEPVTLMPGDSLTVTYTVAENGELTA